MEIENERWERLVWAFLHIMEAESDLTDVQLKTDLPVEDCQKILDIRDEEQLLWDGTKTE